ncbi:MAG: aminoglycoside phosphotransferase family protein [Phycisphaeraceae bacterium]|nr:MAG: aminoglycoside phosphotransferase family protein [Phycisphaeraceae bacterium]
MATGRRRSAEFVGNGPGHHANSIGSRRHDGAGEGADSSTEPHAPAEPVSAPAVGGNGTHGARYTTRHDVEALGVSLGPALHEECTDRLGDIEWFQSPWQKGGAATGYTSWRLPNAKVINAIVKVPIGPREHFWSTRLGEVDPMWWSSDACRHLPVPRVLASGQTLAGYDIAWVIEERVSGKPVSRDMSRDNLGRLFAAAAKFHHLASEVMPAEQGKRRSPMNWDALLGRGEEACRDNDIADAEEWISVIGRVREALPELLAVWRGRPMDTWCHGDLHPGNVLIRCDETCPEDRCCVLIDLALVHPGHWVEDALYLERLYWGRESALRGLDPLAALARHRREIGLHADEFDARLADIRRVLMGATSPAFLSQENDRVYLAAALERLRTILPRIGVHG